MSFPIRCFTCNTVISGKWLPYQKLMKAEKEEGPAPFLEPHQGQTKADKILNQLGITRPCCRRHFLTHVDIVSDFNSMA